MASFPQHTNRDGDPQLHVHNAIANRAQRADGADDKWRALHGQPLFTEQAAARRMLATGSSGQELEQLGWRDGAPRGRQRRSRSAGSARRRPTRSAHRAKELRDRDRELEAEYVRDHGHAPGKRARWAIKQRAALETRDAKEHNPPAAGQELAAWARKAERSGAGTLSALHEAAAAYAAEHAPSELPSEAERARIIRSGGRRGAAGRTRPGTGRS